MRCRVAANLFWSDMNRPPKYRIDTDALAYAARRAGFTRHNGRVACERLAKASGVSADSIHRYAEGIIRNPCSSALIQLAGALGCEPIDLMTEVED